MSVCPSVTSISSHSFKARKLKLAGIILILMVQNLPARFLILCLVHEIFDVAKTEVENNRIALVRSGLSAL